MEFIIQNWESIFIALTSLVTAASAVANITKTEADNNAIAFIGRIINALALNFKK
jgi:hypothetical protein